MKEDCKVEKSIDSEFFFSNRELLYYKNINKYFNTCDIKKIYLIQDIINENSKISLRILIWFVTKYINKTVKCKEGRYFNDVKISYKTHLKVYKKMYFDPFRRKNKFKYNIKRGNEVFKILTTLGQLMFFKWIVSFELFNILDYIKINLNKIIKDMNSLKQ